MLRGQKGYRWHKGVLGIIRGGLGAGRECSYSGARRGIGGIRGYWASSGVLGSLGVDWGLAGSVGTQGPEGI